MTTTALTHRRDHLRDNRRMIIGRALTAAAAGSLPVPLLEEWLTSVIRRRTIARIADSHGVDITAEAAQIIADGPKRAPAWTEVAGVTLAMRLLKRSWRKLLVALVAASRAREASENFLVATLFDHYCAKLHVGLGLDDGRAQDIRRLIDQAIARTKGGLSGHLFKRALRASARASARKPIELADRATRGAVTRLLGRGDETVAITEVDEELERQLAEPEGMVGRAALAIELQLSAEANPYLDDLIDLFDALWKQHLASGHD